MILTALKELAAVTEELHAQFPVPAEVAVAPVNAAGVPGLTLTPAERPTNILFLHGGGYSMGSAFGYRHMAGALAIAAAKFYPRQPDTIAAVTGTSGKTSVAAFTRQIWAALGEEAASIGTIG